MFWFNDLIQKLHPDENFNFLAPGIRILKFAKKIFKIFSPPKQSFWRNEVLNAVFAYNVFRSSCCCNIYLKQKEKLINIINFIIEKNKYLYWNERIISLKIKVIKFCSLNYYSKIFTIVFIWEMLKYNFLRFLKFLNDFI